MAKVLITGPTGNVGIKVIKSLKNINHQLDLYAGARILATGKNKLAKFNIKFVKLDFADSTTCDSSLNDCSILYSLRPPQISEVEKYFKPIIDICKSKGVKHIVFLSVQGVVKSKIIPH